MDVCTSPASHGAGTKDKSSALDPERCIAELEACCSHVHAPALARTQVGTAVAGLRSQPHWPRSDERNGAYAAVVAEVGSGPAIWEAPEEMRELLHRWSVAYPGRPAKQRQPRFLDLTTSQKPNVTDLPSRQRSVTRKIWKLLPIQQLERLQAHGFTIIEMQQQDRWRSHPRETETC